MLAYEEIFNQRGKSYHLAMKKYPQARDEEFRRIAKKLRQIKGSTILDLPAGGGYLKPYLEDDVKYLAYDFSGEFDDQHLGVEKCKESKIDLPSESVDEIVSLAAHHHISSRKEFYKEMYRVLNADGQMVIGDVASGGELEKFLNIFVNRWNSMGHHGRFIDQHDLVQIQSAGFVVEKTEELYQWNFTDRECALDFFRLLFYLDLNPSNQILGEALNNLGNKSGNGFSVNWGLTYLTCKK